MAAHKHLYFGLLSRCGDLQSCVVFTQGFHPIINSNTVPVTSVFGGNSPLSAHQHSDISPSVLHLVSIRSSVAQWLIILALGFDFVTRNLALSHLNCVTNNKLPFPSVVLLKKILETEYNINKV